MNQPAAPPAKKSSRGGTVLAVVGGALILACVLGALLGLPAFRRYIRTAKSTEAVDKVGMICRMVSSTYASTGHMPPGAPRTPAVVPAGARTVDPAGAWSAPGWQAISFAMSDPHYYSYEYAVEGTTFRVRAIGDLDGNGTLATFERAGNASTGGCGPGTWTPSETE
jgi:hypothetical protein